MFCGICMRVIIGAHEGNPLFVFEDYNFEITTTPPKNQWLNNELLLLSETSDYYKIWILKTAKSWRYLQHWFNLQKAKLLSLSILLQ